MAQQNNDEDRQNRSVRFEDEDEAYSTAEYQAITSQSNTVSEWEQQNRDEAARQEREWQQEQDDYWERRNDQTIVRELGKGTRKRLRETIDRKGGDAETQRQSTNAIYDEMGGSPQPIGKRNDWSVRDLQRTAINEHMAQQHIDSKVKDHDQSQSRSNNQKRQNHDQIVNAAREGAKAGEDLQNDPETGIGTNGWFGWLFGTHAETSGPDYEQQELPLDPELEKPDPNREWTMGDLARLFFLGGRDETL